MSNEDGSLNAGVEVKHGSGKISVKPDKTVIKSLALGSFLGGGGPCMVDSKDGKIVRVRPLKYDWKYDKK